MKKIIRFTAVLLILLVLIFGVTEIVFYTGLFGVLSPFSIKSVNRIIGTEYKIAFGKVKAADYYLVEITDSTKEVVYKDKVTKNELDIDFGSILENTNYTLKVTAYNKKGSKRVSNNTYSFTYTKEPFFSKDNVVMLEESGTLVYITGDLSSKKYSLVINKKVYDGEGNVTSEKEIYNKIIDEDIFDLSGDKYNNEIVDLTLSIVKDDKTIDSIDMYYNMNPIKDITIEYPVNDSTIDYSDVLLKFNDDRSAEKYDITLYNNKGTAISTTTIYNNEVLLDKKLFTASGTYSIGINATFKEYNKEARTTFIMDGHSLDPVAISKDVDSITVGDKIELYSNNNAGIIYTTNGANPMDGGISYNGPITINEDTVIKAYAKDGYLISNVSTFDIKVRNSIKDDIKVYLSSSNQVFNLGEEPFTNERYEMDLITDLIEKELKEHNIKLYKNNYLTSAKDWNKDAEEKQVNLKLAIQTESSSNHDKYGLTTYVNNRSQAGFSIANYLHKNIVSLYSSELDDYDHGIKYTNGISTEESSNTSIPNVAVSLGYHDNSNDANWIVTNREKIASNIAKTILAYYGLE